MRVRDGAGGFGEGFAENEGGGEYGDGVEEELAVPVTDTFGAVGDEVPRDVEEFGDFRGETEGVEQRACADAEREVERADDHGEGGKRDQRHGFQVEGSAAEGVPTEGAAGDHDRDGEARGYRDALDPIAVEHDEHAEKCAGQEGGEATAECGAMWGECNLGMVTVGIAQPLARGSPSGFL